MRRRRWRALATALGILALIGILGWSVFPISGRWKQHVRTDDEIRVTPISIEPTQIRSTDGVVQLPDDEWVAIESKFIPNRLVPDVSYLLHHLVNWGPHAQFSTELGALDGPTMFSILVEGRPHSLYKPKSPLLYRDLDHRPRLARFAEPGSESHPNQILATFAALGLPSSQVLRAGGESATIAELIQSARSDFHLQGEVEWTTIALARYAPTAQPWTNRWGHTFDFDAIAEHLMTRPYGEGACAGTHLLHALAIVVSVDSQQRIISHEMRERIVRYLAGAIVRLESHQRSRGCWTPDWALPLADPLDERYDEPIFGGTSLALTTGHHLEWLENAPPELTISDVARRRAVVWCIDALQRVPSITNENLCPYSHCFRMVRRHARVRNIP